MTLMTNKSANDVIAMQKNLRKTNCYAASAGEDEIKISDCVKPPVTRPIFLSPVPYYRWEFELIN